MKAVIQAGAQRKRLIPISAKPVLERLLRWLRRYNLGGMNREAGKPALVLVARHHDLAVTHDSLPATMDVPRRRSLRETSGSPWEIAP
jgi:hypothetical protein